MKISQVIMILVTVAVSMSMLIASAKVQVEPDDKSVTTLVGSVVDASSYEGIAGAEVAVADMGMSTTTDENGAFTIENLVEGTFTIKVDADGYIAAEEEVEITEFGASVEFVLEAEEK